MVRNIFRSRLLALAIAAAVLPAPAAPAKRPAAAKAPQVPLVDVNAASRDELKKLPGVTDAVADRIIAGRPYLSKAKLVSKNVIPMALFQTIRERIVVHPKLPAAK